MTRKRGNSIAALLAFVLLIDPSSILLAQQSSLQTSFLAPASIRPSSPPPLPPITVTSHLPYLNQVAKDLAAKEGGSNFRPTASDLLIQQAEEKLRTGRQFYQNGDIDRARSDFNASIDLMLSASENPTDERLYESQLEEMIDSIHREDLAGMGAAVPDEVPGFDKAPLDDILTMTFPVDPRIKDKVQNEVKSTASALPLVVNDAVLSYINYFTSRGHRTIEGGLARAGRYRAMISRILAEEGVPQELIHLAQAESGFLPRAVSKAAAGGMWQFVKFRGNQYGLMQTPYSDDRFDAEKATRAAAHHLHDLFNEFGDWYLAIAAYNCGPGAIEKAVERTGYADFWELRARGALPIETTNYVPIILAMTIMAKNAPAYGLDSVVPDPPLEYDTIETTAPTGLALVADLTDTPVSELQQLNPALLKSAAPANFEVRVPKGMGADAVAALETVPAEKRLAWRMHRVEPGENLAAIARRFNASPSQIAAANSLGLAEPAPGDRVMIPAAMHEAEAKPRAAAKTSQKAWAVAAVHPRTTPVAQTAKPAPHKSIATIAQIRHTTAPLSR